MVSLNVCVSKNYWHETIHSPSVVAAHGDAPGGDPARWRIPPFTVAALEQREKLE
jgi:hypothetical protein